MKRIIVTGGAGFIGSNFCNLNKKRNEVTALDNLFWGMVYFILPKMRDFKVAL